MGRWRAISGLVVGAWLFGAAGCDATPPAREPVVAVQAPVDPCGAPVDPAALWARHERQGWTEARCAEAATAWRSQSCRHEQKRGRPDWSALYNAALALERCGSSEAEGAFAELLQRQPQHHRARVKVALHRFARTGERDLDGTTAELERAVRDADFQNEEALVALASLELRRAADGAEADRSDALARAELNLKRALAVDDRHMPAYNQLALLHLARARAAAGANADATSARPNAQMLDLAALVVAQALRIDPRHAPLHNTEGLVARAQGDLSRAAAAFQRARTLDPRLFEAHANYASVNLEFRGFVAAEAAYRDALALRPRDYEAHLGLALCLRGRLSEPGIDYPGTIALVERELETAKALAPERPETYYNQAILAEEFKARDAGDDHGRELRRAHALLREFVAKASGKPDYAAASARATERVDDIERILKFTGR
ncbi:MAG: hypothetical protein IT373_04685 [Polyangiaceae bacterium]|nr:hypothetical protein [Polyangiaceae bacterium]